MAVVNLNAEAVYFYDQARSEYRHPEARTADALVSIAASLVILTQHGEKHGEKHD